MKKYLLLLCLLVLWGCEVGKFAPEREKLHGLRNGNDICAQNPSRCIDGYPW